MPLTISATIWKIICTLVSVRAVVESMSVILHPPHPAPDAPAKAHQVQWARMTAPWLTLVWSMAMVAIGIHAILAGRSLTFLPPGRHGGEILPLIFMPLMFAYACLRVGRPRVDRALTERCQSIARGMGIGFRHVKVIETSHGLGHIGSSALGRGRGLTLVVSRGLVDLLSPEEMDFMCAYRLARVKLTSGGSDEVAQPVLGSLMVPVIYLMFPQIRASLKPFWIPMVVYAVALVVVTVMMDRGLPKGRDLQPQADRIAIQTVGRLDIAESCLGKIREFYDTKGDPGLGKDIPNRIAALREAARELGMDPSTEWVQR